MGSATGPPPVVACGVLPEEAVAPFPDCLAPDPLSLGAFVAVEPVVDLTPLAADKGGSEETPVTPLAGDEEPAPPRFE